MKREKYSFKDFYIKPVTRLIKGFWRTLLETFGWWVCDRCVKFLSPRTKKFKYYSIGFSECRRCSVCEGK